MKYSNIVHPASEVNEKTINLIIKEYAKDRIPWFLGYSGGKDSSALLSLVFQALKKTPILHKPVTVIYCDTGVEIPVISNYTKSTLEKLRIEANKHNIPIHIHYAIPKISDSYFVKTIGRGYPPPSNKFRWCTDRLRIKPVQNFINSNKGPKIVLLGVRRGESQERDRTLNKNSTDSEYYFNQNGYSSTTIFSPIANYSTTDVWTTLLYKSLPDSIDSNQLRKLYKDAGTECPILRSSLDTPCSKSRFGCWTCTVVRKDKAMTSMVAQGHYELATLLEFRNWLSIFRDDKEQRCKSRRNGLPGPGPFTLEARRIILEKLLQTQTQSNMELISSEELTLIKELWNSDIKSSRYKEA